MENNEVQTLESGAGEATEPTVPAVQEPQTPVTPAPSGDPLDAIIDPEARAEAKRHRAEARRKENKVQEAPVAAPLPEYAKKDDLGVIVTNQAKELVSDEIRGLWDELAAIPLGGYNAMDARSIASNMKARLAVYKDQQAAKDTSANELITSPGVRGSVGKPTETKKPSSIPRLKDADAQAAELYK